MMIHASNLYDWGLKKSGAAIATVTENSFEYTASASAIATLERIVYLQPGQTVNFSMKHLTTWSRPRIQIVRNEDNLLCNMIDLDFTDGFQRVSLQYTMPIDRSGYVTVTFGSVDGLNAAGSATDIEINVSNVAVNRIVAFGNVSVINGVASINEKYNTYGIESVNVLKDVIRLQLKEKWDMTKRGFSLPVCTVNRCVGGSVNSVVEYITSSTDGGIIDINAVSIEQDIDTKEISFCYRDFSNDTFNINVNVVRD